MERFFFFPACFLYLFDCSHQFWIGFSELDFMGAHCFASWLYGYSLSDKCKPWLLSRGIHQLDFPWLE